MPPERPNRSLAISASVDTAAPVRAGTVIEVLAPGALPAPTRARRRRPGPDAPTRLANVLSDLAAEDAAPVVELNFRKAVEALSLASLEAQAADLACFSDHCASLGRKGLPADDALLVGYIEQLEAKRLRPATVRRRLSSIASAHGYLGMPSPTRNAVVIHALKGMRRRQGVEQRQALPLRLGEAIDREAASGLTLAALLEACERDPQGLRDAALISLGYDGGLRVSELTAVEVEHLEPAADGTGLLFIPSSKTDQERRGAYVWVSADSMRRVRAWLEASGIKAGLLFRRIHVDRRRAVEARAERRISDLAWNARVGRDRLRAVAASPALTRYTTGKAALTRQGVNHIYRRVARRAADLGLVALAGVELERAIASLSTHSLRVGLTQDLFAAGEDAGPIAQTLRWRSTATALRYARKLAPRSNAAARVLSKVRT